MSTSKTRRRPVRHTAPVPNLHFWMLVITGILIVMSMLLYFFASESKAGQFSGYVLLLMGFLTGKLSNNFGKSLSVAPTTEVEDGADEPEGTLP